MSNRFLCNFSSPVYSLNSLRLSERYLTRNTAVVDIYGFFSCAYPLVTSAAIKDVTVNSRFYYVKRLKLDYCYRDWNSPLNGTSKRYMLVYVLNIPQDYVYGFTNPFRLSQLPNHKIPENVLYYDLVTLDQVITDRAVYISKNIHVDITKPFKVLPSYKLVFYVFYIGGNERTVLDSEGSVELFFDVN